MTRRIVLWIAIFGMLGCTLSAADNPSLGTWKLNLTKSTFSPGPAPKSQIVKYEVWEGNGFKVTIDTVTADGKDAHSEFAAKSDGKEYSWSGNPNADTATVKKISERHEKSVWKKNGKVTVTIENVIAPDGKTRTVTHTGTDAQGRMVHNLQFYDKQ